MVKPYVRLHQNHQKLAHPMPPKLLKSLSRLPSCDEYKQQSPCLLVYMARLETSAKI